MNADHEFKSAIFITFSGNCKDALTWYQTCFGGTLQFQLFAKELTGYTAPAVISGSLVAKDITIHGSDLVHNEGRIPGNHMAIFLQCANIDRRRALIEKLEFNKSHIPARDHEEKLIEVTDAFDVRWILDLAI